MQGEVADHIGIAAHGRVRLERAAVADGTWRTRVASAPSGSESVRYWKPSPRTSTRHPPLVDTSLCMGTWFNTARGGLRQQVMGARTCWVGWGRDMGCARRALRSHPLNLI